ncbi:uncharacterized protein BX663DRAFT_485734 [Cokeromyces recurvatus]|uniref:uncharacterized protein n=1 Tax=Cokeromyces recurvatus TaxID=90255 RepID=UPI0022211283|nr:uncharacterized protein BX663DRAFT_485734 [Cokeromyces recurvatus]KAI7903611.1 hypothetical protein BX663DRAFT_485734 [Cokeromyces recurvatus]
MGSIFDKNKIASMMFSKNLNEMADAEIGKVIGKPMGTVMGLPSTMSHCLAIISFKFEKKKQHIVESYSKIISKTTFNQFIMRRENSIGKIDVGAISALYLMKHGISLYNNNEKIVIVFFCIYMIKF